MAQQFHSWVYYPGVKKTLVHTETGIWLFITASQPNSQEMEATWMPTSGWAGKQAVVSPHTAIRASHRKERGLQKGCHVDEPKEHDAKWRRPDIKCHILYDSFYTKHPEEAGPKRLKQTNAYQGWQEWLPSGDGVASLPRWCSGKEPACQCRTVRDCREDPLEKGMATHASILAWRIPMDRGVWWATYSMQTWLSD